MKDLLKVIYEADELLSLIKAQCQSEKEQLIQSVVRELSEIDQMLELHYQASGKDSNQIFHA